MERHIEVRFTRDSSFIVIDKGDSIDYYDIREATIIKNRLNEMIP